jgi:hypothetical protein
VHRCKQTFDRTDRSEGLDIILEVQHNLCYRSFRTADGKPSLDQIAAGRFDVAEGCDSILRTIGSAVYCHAGFHTARTPKDIYKFSGNNLWSISMQKNCPDAVQHGEAQDLLVLVAGRWKPRVR